MLIWLRIRRQSFLVNLVFTQGGISLHASTHSRELFPKEQRAILADIFFRATLQAKEVIAQYYDAEMRPTLAFNAHMFLAGCVENLLVQACREKILPFQVRRRESDKQNKHRYTEFLDNEGLIFHVKYCRGDKDLPIPASHRLERANCNRQLPLIFQGFNEDEKYAYSQDDEVYAIVMFQHDQLNPIGLSIAFPTGDYQGRRRINLSWELKQAMNTSKAVEVAPAEAKPLGRRREKTA